MNIQGQRGERNSQKLFTFDTPWSTVVSTKYEEKTMRHSNYKLQFHVRRLLLREAARGRAPGFKEIHEIYIRVHIYFRNRSHCCQSGIFLAVQFQKIVEFGARGACAVSLFLFHKDIKKNSESSTFGAMQPWVLMQRLR